MTEEKESLSGNTSQYPSLCVHISLRENGLTVPGLFLFPHIRFRRSLSRRRLKLRLVHFLELRMRGSAKGGFEREGIPAYRQADLSGK